MDDKTCSGVRIVKAAEFMPMALELIARGAAVPLVVSGNSMEPFLTAGRDSVILTARRAKKPRRGDILLFTRPDGSYVVHRVHRADGSGVRFVGDAQSFIEGPVPYGHLLAEVRTVIRRGAKVGRHSPVWLYFAWRRAARTFVCRLRGDLGRCQ